MNDYYADSEVMTPPYSEQAEQSVLGGLMLDNSTFSKISLNESDFYFKQHAVIFGVIKRLAETGCPFDVLTISELFEETGMKEANLPFLGMLARDTPSAANIEFYAKIVKEKAVLRHLMTIGSDLYHAAVNPKGRSVTELIGEFSSKILQAQGGVLTDSYDHSIKDVFTKTIEKLEISYDRFADYGGIAGKSTGLKGLDEVTGGFQFPDFWVILAQSRMGKTALLLNFAVAANCPAGIISSEQGAVQVGERIISSAGSVNNQELRTGDIKDDSWSRIIASIARLSDKLIFVNDEPLISIDNVVIQARKWKAEHDVQVLFLDYLQNISDPSAKSPIDRVSNVSRRLRALAKELDICIVALSQVKREIDSRSNKRPRITDASDASQIEKDGDVIISIYRDEVYWDKDADNDESKRGIAEIGLLKNKHGESDTTFECLYEGQFFRFRDKEVSYSGAGYEN